MRRHLRTTATVATLALLAVLTLVGTGFGAPSGNKGKGKPKPPPSPSPSTDCSGYAERRQFVDAQGWWTTTPGMSGTDFGHVHVGACIPERETIRGIVPLNIRVVLHDNPGTLRYVAVVVKGPGYETTVAKPTVANFTCPTGTCTQWLTYNLDTSAFAFSGRQEIRLRTIVDTPDGNAMHGGINFQVVVDNGKPLDDYEREPHLRGKGWYTTAGYCEATFKSVPIPDAPLSGLWSPTIAMIEHSTGTVNMPVSRHSVRLDADIHAGNLGTLVKEGAGAWEGSLPIDTTTLANGPHKLMLKAECDDPSGSTNAGVLVIPFDVSN